MWLLWLWRLAVWLQVLHTGWYFLLKILGLGLCTAGGLTFLGSPLRRGWTATGWLENVSPAMSPATASWLIWARKPDRIEMSM
jgi:hypothetical protein